MGRQDGRIVGGVDHRGRAAGASSLLVGGVVGSMDHRGRAAPGASLLVGGVVGGVEHRGRAAAGASLLLVGGIYAAASPGGHATRLHRDRKSVGRERVWSDV